MRNCTNTQLLRKMLIVLLLCSFIAGTFTACSDKKQSDGKTTFTVGFDAEFPPYGYKDESGEYVGFDLSLAEEVCRRNGWELVKQPIDWDSKDMELSSGSIDCIWNGFTLNGREREYTWSKAYIDNSQVVIVKSGSGIKKFSELDRHDNSNTDKSKYKRVCIGDIAYNSMRMWQGASGRSSYEGIVSPAYTVVKPIGDIDTQFFAYMFKKKEIIHLFEINSQGLTSDTWNLKYPAFSKIVVRVPRNVEEQSRIARFLLELDELISCTEQEIEITKRMKKGCLQKMFV